MIRTYLACHVCLAPLIFAVKAWAKQHGVADASQATLSSYAYTILVIHYMQQLGLLPYLQTDLDGYACALARSQCRWWRWRADAASPVAQLRAIPSMPPLQEVRVGKWNVAFYHDVDALVRAGHVRAEHVAREYLVDGIVPEPQAAAPAGLGKLLAGFFHYYGYVFDFATRTVRPRRGVARRRPRRDPRSWRTSCSTRCSRWGRCASASGSRWPTTTRRGSSRSTSKVGTPAAGRTRDPRASALTMHAAAELEPVPLPDPFDLEHNLGRSATQRCAWLRSPGAVRWNAWELTSFGEGEMFWRVAAAGHSGRDHLEPDAGDVQAYVCPRAKQQPRVGAAFCTISRAR